MSRVLKTNDRKILKSAGFRIDRIIHKRRRERDLRLKHIKYVKGIKS